MEKALGTFPKFVSDPYSLAAMSDKAALVLLDPKHIA